MKVLSNASLHDFNTHTILQRRRILNSKTLSPKQKKDDYDDDVIASASTTKASAPHYPHHTITSSNQPNNETNESRPLLLLLCATGITSCYLWYGTVQEHLFQIDNANSGDDKQSITLFLLATGTFSSFLLALVWIVIGPLLLAQTTDRTSGKENSPRDHGQVQDNGQLNHPLLALTSITYLSAMAASNESLHYVSYPTCVLAKSSKLIPTMVVGWLVDKYRSYGRIGIQQNNNSSTSSSTNHKGINGMEWLGAALITIGILSFQYIQLQKQSNDSSHPHGSSDGEDKDEKGDSPYGLALLGLSLFMWVAWCMPKYFEANASFIIIILNKLSAAKCNGNNVVDQPLCNTDSHSVRAHVKAITAAKSICFTGTSLHISHNPPLFSIDLYDGDHDTKWCSVGLVFGGLYLEIVAKFIGEKGDGDGKKQKED
eukprot:scaffold1059_cov216-Skeletonema_marinoi.AAC.1